MLHIAAKHGHANIVLYLLDRNLPELHVDVLDQVHYFIVIMLLAYGWGLI